MFSLRRPTGKVVLVADVEDSSVGVSIAHISRHGAATILASERVRLPIEERSTDQAASAVLQKLDECVQKVLGVYGADAKNAKPPRAVYAILRSPWTEFRTMETNEAFPEPRAVTKELIATLAQRALAAPPSVPAPTAISSDTVVLETGVMKVALNGYPTGNPIGKKVIRAGVIAYESRVHKAMHGGVISTLQKHLPGRTPLVKSGTRTILAVLNEHIPDIHRFVILDMGSGVTNCSVVLRESVSQSVRVSEGLSTILKRLAGAGLPEEMLTQLRMLSSDTCSSDACRALKDSLARAEPELTKVFGEAFAKLATPRRLPNSAMLLAPEELVPWLQGFFSRIDFSQFTTTMQPLVVVPLTADHLREIVEWAPAGPVDSGLSLATGYVKIIEQSAG